MIEPLLLSYELSKAGTYLLLLSMQRLSRGPHKRHAAGMCFHSGPRHQGMRRFVEWGPGADLLTWAT